jgi:hypothetical protein
MQNQPLEVAVAQRAEPEAAAVAQYPRLAGRGECISRDERPLRLIVVQNKIAMGSDRLVEDSRPAYLSTKPVPYGKRLGCAVPNTNMWSAAVVPVAHQVMGAYMVNYDVRDASVQDNPHKVESTRWYLVVLPDGRTGYLSEIYVEPRFRGGLKLPTIPSGPHPT